MLSDQYQAELALLFGEMEDFPEDDFELYEKIHEKLNELRAFGLELPKDLARFEEDLRQRVGLSDSPDKVA